MSISTADLTDEHRGNVQVAAPVFRTFGGRTAFGGPVVTIRTFEDNSLVRKALEEPGDERVLVVDGAGSMRCALLGDRLAALGAENGWSGVIVHGCVRDTAILATIDLGVQALAPHPCKSEKRGRGERDVPVYFAGLAVEPGAFLYADTDGIIVSAEALQIPNQH
jgi:regulator of ribonuclease activity A